MPFCSKCGTELKVNVKFCTSCGSPVKEKGKTNTSESTNNNSNTSQVSRGRLIDKLNSIVSEAVNEIETAVKSNKPKACSKCGHFFIAKLIDQDTNTFESLCETCDLEQYNKSMPCDQCGVGFIAKINKEKNKYETLCEDCKNIQNVIDDDDYPKRIYTNRNIDIRNVINDIKDLYLGELSDNDVTIKAYNPEVNVVLGQNSMVILKGETNSLLVRCYVPVNYDNVAYAKGNLFSGVAKEIIADTVFLGAKESFVFNAQSKMYDLIRGNYTSKSEAKKEAKEIAEKNAYSYAGLIINKVDEIIKMRFKFN